MGYTPEQADTVLSGGSGVGAAPVPNARANPPAKPFSNTFEAQMYGTPEEAAKARKIEEASHPNWAMMPTNDEVHVIAEGIRNGTYPGDPKGLTRNGMWGKVAAELMNDGFDLRKYNLEWEAQKRHMLTMNSQQSASEFQAIDFARQAFAKAGELYDQLHQAIGDTGFRSFNKVALETAKQLPGDTGKLAQQLETQIADSVAALSKVYMGGGTPTDRAMQLAAKNLAGNWNKATFEGALRQLNENLGYRYSAMLNTPTVGPYGIMPQGGGAAQTPPTGGAVPDAASFWR
jgi:hypothetical protein